MSELYAVLDRIRGFFSRLLHLRLVSDASYVYSRFQVKDDLMTTSSSPLLVPDLRPRPNHYPLHSLWLWIWLVLQLLRIRTPPQYDKAALALNPTTSVVMYKGAECTTPRPGTPSGGGKGKIS